MKVNISCKQCPLNALRLLEENGIPKLWEKSIHPLRIASMVIAPHTLKRCRIVCLFKSTRTQLFCGNTYDKLQWWTVKLVLMCTLTVHLIRPYIKSLGLKSRGRRKTMGLLGTPIFDMSIAQTRSKSRSSDIFKFYAHNNEAVSI